MRLNPWAKGWMAYLNSLPVPIRALAADIWTGTKCSSEAVNSWMAVDFLDV